jgi:hypothetical protein
MFPEYSCGKNISCHMVSGEIHVTEAVPESNSNVKTQKIPGSWWVSLKLTLMPTCL